MDTITTDSGKVYKLEEAWVLVEDCKRVKMGNKRYALGGPEIKRVWVLVEVEEPTVDISNPQWERIEDDI